MLSIFSLVPTWPPTEGGLLFIGTQMSRTKRKEPQRAAEALEASVTSDEGLVSRKRLGCVRLYAAITICRALETACDCATTLAPSIKGDCSFSHGGRTVVG